MSVDLYMIEYEIDGQTYSANLPARSFDHAHELAAAIGGKVLGTNVHEITAIPAERLMEFCSAIANEPINWPYNAAEQLEAFLSIGWKREPEELP